MSDRQTLYNDLQRLAEQAVSISDLFKTEPDRLKNFVISQGSLRADFSKQAISQSALSLLLELVRICDVEGWRNRLMAGDKINSSEDRAVLHMALRGTGGSAAVKKDVKAMRTRLAEFANKIRKGRKFKSIVHIGIGGSDLGPRLIAEGLAATNQSQFDLRFAENIDGASINDALEGLDPKSTLVVVVSKSRPVPSQPAGFYPKAFG